MFIQREWRNGTGERAPDRRWLYIWMVLFMLQKLPETGTVALVLVPRRLRGAGRVNHEVYAQILKSILRNSVILDRNETGVQVLKPN